MCGGSASSCSGWCLATHPSASNQPTRQLLTNREAPAGEAPTPASHQRPAEIDLESVKTLIMVIVAVRRSNLQYSNSWVKEGADGYHPDSSVREPVKAAYAAKLASGDSTYDDLKKMCDGMLATKDDRWSLQACLVRERSPAMSRLHLPPLRLSNSTSRAAGARHSPREAAAHVARRGRHDRGQGHRQP
eukprot:COSAG06_NODE_507_length_14929_cov_109.047067_3_plen_189_part_00